VENFSLPSLSLLYVYYFCQGRAAKNKKIYINCEKKLIFALFIISSQLNDDDDKVKADEKITLEWTATTFQKAITNFLLHAEN